MGWIDKLTAAILGIAVATAWAPAPADACTIQTLARLPITTYRGLPVVGVSVAGHQLPMVLDTGAHGTVLTPEAAADAGLPADHRHLSRMHGLATPERAGWTYDAVVTSLSLGTMELGPGHIHVAPILGSAAGDAVAGVLGADLLSRHDLELDMPHATATIYDVHGCVGDFVPWNRAHDRVEAAWTDQDQAELTIPSSIGGTPVRSFVDTGAAASMVTRTAAAAAGVDDASMTAGEPVTGIDATGNGIPGRTYAFPRLQVGNETFRNTTLMICDCKIPNADLQIGEDYLQVRTVWLSYQTGQIFIIRAGSRTP